MVNSDGHEGFVVPKDCGFRWDVEVVRSPWSPGGSPLCPARYAAMAGACSLDCYLEYSIVWNLVGTSAFSINFGDYDY